MRPTRRAQPHRKGSPFRRPGASLDAMLRGRDAFGRNPMDTPRAIQKAANQRRRRRRNRRRRAA